MQADTEVIRGGGAVRVRRENVERDGSKGENDTRETGEVEEWNAKAVEILPKTHRL